MSLRGIILKSHLQSTMNLSFYNTRWQRNALPFKPNIMTRNVDGIEIIGNARYYEECDSLEQAKYKDWEC